LSFVAAAWASRLPADDLKIGLLVPQVPGTTMSDRTKAALDVARRAGTAMVLYAADSGEFVTADGAAADLGQFDVLWYHHGESVGQTRLLGHKQSVAAIRGAVSGGRGLYLSGAALAMVNALGIERANPRIGNPGVDQNTASLTPAQPKHPVFRGLQAAGNRIPLNDGGYPAFADFHGSGGPAGGMLLAHAAPNSRENPLVEYALGKGRVIAIGWRLPHYANAANVHRENLQRLTTNILTYLADERQWQAVVVRPASQLPATVYAPGVPERSFTSLKLAIEDLTATYPDRYARGRQFLARLDQLQQQHDRLLDNSASRQDESETAAALDALAERFERLKAEALLANPLLDFEQLMLIDRHAGNRVLPTNYQSNSSLPRTGHDNRIAVLSPVTPDGELTTLYQPEGGRFVGDVDLDFGADKLLFSTAGTNGRWQIHEVDADGSNRREMTLIEQPDVDNYDACYLPDGRIIFTSTAPFVGVPCVRGGSHVTNLYIRELDGSIRQLTVDQEHNWCPTVLNNGRVLYLRWEYTDVPHAFYRILFHMNPDGTEQMEYYGSNSYWPNAMFYARPIPDHPTKVVAVVGGHHAPGRSGELVIFDPARGRHEAEGAIQRIPGRGKEVEAVLVDGLAAGSWPKFLHPYPLSEKYFLASCRLNNHGLWGIYLVDAFDNFLLLHEAPGRAMMEPIPLRATPKPPAVPDKVNPARRDAVVAMADVYSGPGLAGVPRGTIKRMRLFSYHFSYHGMGGQTDRVGLDGPWDVKQIIGTVPVEPDGSAHFRVPAYTPISVQPLDGEGKAVQLMRSWFTAMPGEVLSCVGCHDKQNTAPPVRLSEAMIRPPSRITPWYGPARGFGFQREVQPVLDKYCVGCHDGKTSLAGEALVDLTDRPHVNMRAGSAGYNNAAHFSPSYFELRKFVRSPTIESDLQMLPPWEFHADSTKLVQMLRKGHHGVKLDAEAHDRLITWIDLHTPAHGNWTDVCGAGRVARQSERRRAMRKLYTGIDDDPEVALAAADLGPAVATALPSERPSADVPDCPGWPFDAAEALRRQSDGSGERPTLRIDLGDGVVLEMVRIPAGEFVMGDAEGYDDEGPATRVTIERPFWLGRFEISNRQYAQFDPAHDSRLEHGDFLQFSTRERGYPLGGPAQPVVRVSQRRAIEFCRWLSAQTGRRFDLPSEAQWEYACRAGTATPLSYGTLDDDFSPYANVSDAVHQSVDTFGWGLPSGAIPPWRPADTRFSDKFRVSAPVGSYTANAWGLHDMHGNVGEWTRSTYRPYPYSSATNQLTSGTAGRKVVRGGSWYDRPKRCRSASRLAYHADQVVFDVGFRVICQAADRPDIVNSDR